ncbi:MAG: YtpR family tRNA-binding protein, partial [Campylobacteraceae bacterium]
MIVTKNWLKEWIDISSISTDELCKTLNDIGLEIDSVTKHKMPEYCVVGYVKQRVQHPDADKLSVCTVDVGSEIVQIVCGAKNVAEGQFVAVSLVGAKLPNGLEIKKAKLRGVESCGMICSSTELGLPKINDGIMILSVGSYKFPAGTALREIPELNDDVIEIGLTPNRGDCLSIHGVARDLSAALNLKVKTPAALEDDVSQIGIGRVLDLRVVDKINSSLVYKVIYPKELKSNLTIDLRLAFVGIDAKSVIDKHLSYSTHASGVILRAYKGDLFVKDEDGKVDIIIKKDTNGLDIVCAENTLSCVGVFQEKETKANDDDKFLIIEASYINPEFLANHGAREIKKADSYLYRTLRGSEPELCFGINFLGYLFNTTSKVGILAGTQQIVEDKELRRVNVDIDDMFSIIGKELPRVEIIDILNRLGFKTLVKPEQNLISVEVPHFRHDVENMQD